MFCALPGSKKPDIFHQVVLVRSADWDVLTRDVDGALVDVDVVDVIQVYNEISAHTHKVFRSQDHQQVFERGLNVVLPGFQLDGTVFPFHLDKTNFTQFNAAQFVADLGVELVVAAL